MQKDYNPAGYTLDNIYERSELRVIGWDSWESDGYEDEDITDEVFFVVARDVKDHEYLFGGDVHQDCYGCAPVLNTGRMVRLSTRNWGLVIAIAYDARNSNGDYNYMLGYMDMFIKDEYKKRPPDYVDLDKLLPAPEREDIDLVLPPPACYLEPIKLFICAETEKTKAARLLAFAHIHDTYEQNAGLFSEMRISRIFHEDSFEKLLNTLKERTAFYPPPVPDEEFGLELGIHGAATSEELLAKLHQLYPDTDDGVVAFFFSERRL